MTAPVGRSVQVDQKVLELVQRQATMRDFVLFALVQLCVGLKKAEVDILCLVRKSSELVQTSKVGWKEK